MPKNDGVRYFAIDLGDKRTGIAVGDDETGIAAPVETLEVPVDRNDGEALLEAIARSIDAHTGRDGVELVVGLPLNMDGSEGARAKATRAFAFRLEARTGLVMRLVDERLTSAAADEAFAQRARSGARLTHGQRKARRDAQAAAALLAAFFESGPIK